MNQKKSGQIVVGIDIETTSLDPTLGHIIEVAAIRYDLASGQEIDRFETLCAAPFVSPEVTALTGITPEMLEGKAPFADHIKELKNFIGSDTLLAHNGNFDLAWLARHGLPLSNPLWDTFYLASLVWPNSASYNLGTLTREQGITTKGEHRASADIVLTWELFKTIRKNLQKLPSSLEKTFQNLLTASGQAHYLGLCNFTEELPKKSSVKKIVGRESHKNIDLLVADLMGEDGVLSQNLPGFIPRPEQVKLTEYLKECTENNQNALVEGGPGIGKTFAYLVAGLTAGGRMMVSTHSKILQDQIISKDIPRLLKALGISRSYASLKGRRNYVCGSRLAALLKGSKFSQEDAWILAKIALWLARGGTGDVETINLSHQGHLLSRLHADNAVCREVCRPNTCPYHQARQKASEADLVIVNHALLMQWGLGEDNARQDFKLLIVDEAHQLEEAARKASEIEFSQERLSDIFEGGGSFLKGEQIRHEVGAIHRHWDDVLRQAHGLVEEHASGSTLRLSRTLRRSQGFKKLIREGSTFLSRLRFLVGFLRSQKVPRKQEKLQLETLQNLEKMSIEWEELLGGKSQQRVQYIQASLHPEKVRIVDTPLQVSEYIAPFLNLGNTLLLSATITVEGKCDYIKKQLGLSSWQEKVFSSAFKYDKQMAVAVIDNGPYPGSEAHDLFGASLIKEVGNLTRGKILVLMTSKQSLSSVHRATSSDLHKENIRTLSQGISGGRNNIAKRFQGSEASVLLGLSSFWEGFDAPGEALSVLVIPKLPFPAVGDPVIEALTELLGPKAFEEVMLPKMILRLRQGIGRLIRSVTDRGVVIIVDRRLSEKEYGKKVLHSLPACPIQVLAGEDLSTFVTDFFGPETITRWQKK